MKPVSDSRPSVLRPIFSRFGMAAPLGVVLFAFSAASSAALAQTFRVDRTDDATVSACTSSANDCTLRGAIAAANAASGATINFDPTVFATAQTIQLASVLPALSKSMGILNTSGASVTVRGQGTANPYRIFTIDSGQTVTISGLSDAVCRRRPLEALKHKPRHPRAGT